MLQRETLKPWTLDLGEERRGEIPKTPIQEEDVRSCNPAVGDPAAMSSDVWVYYTTVYYSILQYSVYAHRLSIMINPMIDLK